MLHGWKDRILSRKIDIIKKNHTENLELKNTVSEIKTSPERWAQEQDKMTRKNQ